MVGDRDSAGVGRLAGRRLIYTRHAQYQMDERDIPEDDVYLVADTGEAIRNYPDDRPYQSELILGWVGEMPLHIVLAYNEPADEFIVITAYYPDRYSRQSNFRERI